MDPSSEWITTLREILASQALGVLSTHDRSGPHASLVAFAPSDDLRGILFATPRTTRKFAHLSANPRGALLVDNRSNTPADFTLAVAATARGVVEPVAPEDRDASLGLYLDRHPHLSEFVRAPSCALLRLRVEAYSMVRRFQEVTEIRILP